MTKKINLTIFFGGKSAEHEVSIASAKNIISALDKTKYHINKLFIPKSGTLPKIPKDTDVVFPVLHGPYGEDGTIQGMLKIQGIPFVGAGVLGSAIGMDKDVQKRLLKEAGVKIAKFQVLTHPKEAILLPLPLFIKPANLGSSVGITKAKSEKDLSSGISLAFSHDKKVIIEEEILGRELEVSVLGGTSPKASLPGEIFTSHSFYDYEAKYQDNEGTKLNIPAKLPAKKIKEVQDLALKTFNVLCCEGMARVDFFLDNTGVIYVNELNTIPGFTNSSMYPKLWEASGIPQTQLLDKLIGLALEGC